MPRRRKAVDVEAEYTVKSRVPMRPRLTLHTEHGSFTLLPETNAAFQVVDDVWVRAAFRNVKGDWQKQTATTAQILSQARKHTWRVEIEY